MRLFVTTGEIVVMSYYNVSSAMKTTAATINGVKQTRQLSAILGGALAPSRSTAASPPILRAKSA